MKMYVACDSIYNTTLGSLILSKALLSFEIFEIRCLLIFMNSLESCEIRQEYIDKTKSKTSRDDMEDKSCIAHRIMKSF